jgi:hypothetical protein
VVIEFLQKKNNQSKGGPGQAASPIGGMRFR